MKTALTLTAALFLLTACASDRAYREGERLMAEGRTEEGLARLEEALREKPDNAQIRSAYLRSREARQRQHMDQAEAAFKAGQLDDARLAYQAVLKMHPENPRALEGLVAIETQRRNQGLVQEAEEALKKGELETARLKARMVLAQEPRQARAVALLKEIDTKAGKPQGAKTLELDPRFRRTISLEFRDAPLRSVIEAISRQSGLNFVLDKDIRTDARATVYARETGLMDAVDMVLATNQLDRKVVSPNTLVVYPNQPAKQREYQELVVKSFFLGNADAKTTLNMVKTLARSRDVFIDEKLNLLVVRDTPEAVRLIEKLVAVQDRPDAEVMLEVEILEVKRSRLQDLGVQWPTQFSVLSIADIKTVTNNNGVTVDTTSQVSQALTVDMLKNLNSQKIGVSPNPGVVAKKDASDVNILANPRIRVKNKEKAKIHIGDKVPVITTNTTSTGVVSESVAYLDVGLKLDVEPLVHLDSDVDIKVALEVSNIVQQIKSSTGTLTYQIGSRNANTVLRLKDGETQVLAGLIADEDRKGANKVPGFGDLPLLGRLFASRRDELSKTEIVLLITPRVVRNLERPDLAQAEFFAGTEASVSDQPMGIRSSNTVTGGRGSAGGMGFRPQRPPIGLPRPAPAPGAPVADPDSAAEVPPEVMQGLDQAQVPPAP
ncbi:MAG: tetratricopeptide repeat protein [Pseudomonadota bacterium]